MNEPNLVVAPNAMLLDETFRHKEWEAVRSITMHRRPLVADIDHHAQTWKGRLICINNRPYPVPYDVGTVFGADAGDYRWVSTYKKADHTGRMYHRSHTVERLRWLELYLCWTKPDWVEYREDVLRSFK